MANDGNVPRREHGHTGYQQVEQLRCGACDRLMFWLGWGAFRTYACTNTECEHFNVLYEIADQAVIQLRRKVAAPSEPKNFAEKKPAAEGS